MNICTCNLNSDSGNVNGHSENDGQSVHVQIRMGVHIQSVEVFTLGRNGCSGSAGICKEWKKLDSTIREQFKKQLAKRLENPRIASARLSGMEDCYKIKLRSAGYRLVYQVRDQEVVISVVAVGKRENNLVYKIAAKRI